jgi:mono/diheme cytochrome c family protein
VKTVLKIFAFTILVSAFYSYVGQMVPQKITYPPETAELSEELSTEEMVEVGQTIVAAKGTCLGCHTLGASGSLRFPDLANIGAVAGSRVAGLDDVEYLAQSLYEPNAFIVDGFLAGMPPIGKPPISLTDQEILTVIAYLQSLGGTPTVTMQTELEYAGQSPQAAPSGGPAVASAAPATNRDGPTLFGQYLCTTCHTIDAPTPLVGPSLYDVGARLTKAQIYEALMEPDATIAEGYSAGVMGATISALGFPGQLSTVELKSLVDFLASHTGE